MEALSLYRDVEGLCEQCKTSTLSELAKIKTIRHEYDDAIQLLSMSLEEIDAKRGKLNDDYLSIAVVALETFIKSGQIEKATDLINELYLIENKIVQRTAAHFSQKEIQNFLPRISKTEDWFATLAIHYTVSDNRFFSSFYNALLQKKERFLNFPLISQLNLAILTNDSKNNYIEWQQIQKQFTTQLSNKESSKATRDSLESLSITLEKKLVQSVSNFEASTNSVTWVDIKQQLDDKAAAIEFIRFNDKIKDEFWYAALIVLPKSEAPIFVKLSKENEILSLIAQSSSWLSDYINRVYSKNNSGGKKSLYYFIWSQIENHLNGVDKIFFSSSGILHRINLEAIQNPEGTTLGEKYKFVKLGSTRQLKNQYKNSKDLFRTSLIYGGIQYELDPTKIQVNTTDSGDSDFTSSTRSNVFTGVDSILRNNTWEYLPSTKTELANIKSILKNANYSIDAKVESDASEESFRHSIKNNTSPRILHIATHGFFFPDPQQSHATGPVFKTNPNPMMRSGLILAGANYAWKHGKPLNPGMEDGILTAYEISLMDLSHTELVVLSACETGLGDIAGNEGVYGLQRAFKIAGAKYLIMSLWKVPDVQTEELMTLFYQKWLEDQMPIPEAFRAAQGIMRKKYPNPYYWAGFILQE